MRHQKILRILLYVLPGLLIWPVFLAALWVGGYPHQGSAISIASLPARFPIASQLRTFPSNGDVRWSRTSLMNDTFEIRGRTTPELVSRWDPLSLTPEVICQIVENGRMNGPGESMAMFESFESNGIHSALFIGQNFRFKIVSRNR